jgi:hypothetical protein
MWGAMTIDLPSITKLHTTAHRLKAQQSLALKRKYIEAVIMAPANLPKNAHVSVHPCLKAKLSQLRSAKTGSRDAQTLVHEIALMIGYEALGAGLTAKQEGNVSTFFMSNT